MEQPAAPWQEVAAARAAEHLRGLALIIPWVAGLTVAVLVITGTAFFGIALDLAFVLRVAVTAGAVAVLYVLLSAAAALLDLAAHMAALQRRATTSAASAPQTAPSAHPRAHTTGSP